MAASVFPLADRRPFPNASGRGIRIGVIDSGINPKHPHIVAAVSGAVINDDDFVPSSQHGGSGAGSDAAMDQLGHGTAVMAAIQEKAPDAQYTAVKLFHESLSSTSVRLMRAMQWAIDQRFDLVNLSLGTPNLEHRSAFVSLVERANAAGVTLVCARQESERPVLPGMLPGVIPVDVDWRLTRHAYRIEGTPDAPVYFASGFPRPLPGVSPIRNLSGISFAVANMTGILARACEQADLRTWQAIARALATESLRLRE